MPSLVIHSNTIMSKTPFSLKLEADLMESVKRQALKEHRPVNNFIEVVLIKYLEDVKNQEEKENPAE